jgi:ribonuclease HII
VTGGPRAAGDAATLFPAPRKRRRGDPCNLLSEDLGGALVAGLDEAGRGPLAGPVVAAAVVLDPAKVVRGLDDSKKLDAAAREVLHDRIVERARAWGVGVVEPARIDEINILRASLEAMAIAFAACRAMAGGTVVVAGAIVDGNQRAPLPDDVTQKTLIGGDAKSRPIMAASVLAKVVRDRRMVAEAALHPGWGFERHKGYSTKAHFEALIALGPSPIHRRSFAPVRLAQQGTLALGHFEKLFVDDVDAAE